MLSGFSSPFRLGMAQPKPFLGLEINTLGKKNLLAVSPISDCSWLFMWSFFSMGSMLGILSIEKILLKFSILSRVMLFYD